MKSLVERAEAVFGSDGVPGVRALLTPYVDQGDREATLLLGNYLLYMDGEEREYQEGVALLRTAADAGCGNAAHNLATALFVGGPGMPPDHEEAYRYMQIAVDTGFEATIVKDPYWWKRGPKTDS
jgi:TPR repeat protein